MTRLELQLEHYSKQPTLVHKKMTYVYYDHAVANSVSELPASVIAQYKRRKITTPKALP